MILLKFYAFLMKISAPLLRFVLKKQALRRGIPEERHQEFWGNPTEVKKNIHIWGHAVSVGETRSLLTLLDFLAKRYPDWHFLVTTTTATAAHIVKTHNAPYIIHQYLPFDVPSWIDNFLNFWQPKSVIFIEQEIWPNIIFACRQKNIPMGLVNGKLTEKSLKKWQKIRSTAKYLTNAFQVILAQSEQDRIRLQSICDEKQKVVYGGNLKLAAAPLQSNKYELQNLKRMIDHRPFWLAASLHVGEEQFVLEAHKKVVKDYPKGLVIIVPRHPNMTHKYQEACQRLALTYAIRSKKDVITPSTQVYIADTLGELGTFYALSSIVLVGGSLVPNIGGHNPIEPAHLDTAILIGPYTHNCKEIHEEMLLSKSIITVREIEDISSNVIEFLQNTSKRESAKKAAKQYAQSHDPIREIFTFIHRVVVPTQEGKDARAVSCKKVMK